MRVHVFLLILLASCVDTIEGGECNVDGDCPAESPTCVFDVDQAKSYCSLGCTAVDDCPRDMICRFGVAEELTGAVETGLCIRRVRDCSGVEVCNGLDDDCNGVIDDAGCELVTSCNDDLVCGAFLCTAPVDQPTTVCTPGSESSSSYFDDCTADDQCPNGLCSAGFCSPLCRARGDFSTSCERDLECARGMGARSRPQHNICQVPCNSPSQCDGDTQCVWRDIHQPANFDHIAVCSLLDPGRMPLGSTCPSHTIEGDDLCQYGLCLQNVCTRICGGPGASCADVGPDFNCEAFDIGTGQIHAVCRR